jgi:hypothetical protein
MIGPTLRPYRGVYKYCPLCGKRRLHIDGLCHICTVLPTSCRWTARCPGRAVVTVSSPYGRQLGLPTVPVCGEHRRTAVAAGWSV